jgi:hypothetical protein
VTEQWRVVEAATVDNVQEYIIEALFSLAALAADAKHVALARMIIDTADSTAMMSL